jgi:hypothetical protein
MIFRQRWSVLEAALLSVAIAGCASVQQATQSRAPVDQSRSCSLISGAKTAMTPGVLLLLGELHGTAEIPGFVGNLVCEASLSGSEVQVGLEIPTEEQLRIDSFLASTGSPQDRQALLEGDFWRRSLQDGRSSRAMIDLLDSIRRLRASGARINVFSFDVATRVPDRDGEMAKKIMTVHAQAPSSLFILLTGNLHAMKQKATIGSTELVPMGFHLFEAGAQVRSLNSAYPPGTAWACMGTGTNACGLHDIRGKDRGKAPFIELGGHDERGYDGIFYVPSLTASPPAAVDQ